MTTGYTAPVVEGQITSLRDFALRCSQAFGARVLDRDSPMGTPWEPRTEDPYYAGSVREAENDLARRQAYTDADWDRVATETYERQVADYARWTDNTDKEAARVDAMLAKVISWTPPTPEHEEFKSFMEEQLRLSTPYRPTPPIRNTGAEMKALLLPLAETTLERARERLEGHRRQVAEANAWMQALIDSL